MLGERMAPCWCYSPIHFEWRRKRFQGHALLQGRGECKMKKYIYCGDHGCGRRVTEPRGILGVGVVS